MGTAFQDIQRAIDGWPDYAKVELLVKDLKKIQREVLPDNVTLLDVVTVMEIPTSRIVQGVLENKIKHFVLFGYDEEGKRYMASSGGLNCAEILWLLECGKQEIMDTGTADGP